MVTVSPAVTNMDSSAPSPEPEPERLGMKSHDLKASTGPLSSLGGVPASIRAPGSLSLTT